MVCIGFREVLVGLDGFSHCGLQWCIVDGFTMIYIIYIYIDIDNIPYDILMLYRQQRTSNIGKFYGYDSMTLQ